MKATRLASGVFARAALSAGPATAFAQADWPTYGGNDWNQRWSTLKQINTSNVKRLVPRMGFQTNVSKLGALPPERLLKLEA